MTSFDPENLWGLEMAPTEADPFIADLPAESSTGMAEIPLVDKLADSAIAPIPEQHPGLLRNDANNLVDPFATSGSNIPLTERFFAAELGAPFTSPEAKDGSKEEPPVSSEQAKVLAFTGTRKLVEERRSGGARPDAA